MFVRREERDWNKRTTTPKHIANSFTKQFIDPVKHATNKTNRYINRATQTIQGHTITHTTTQVQEAIKLSKNNNSHGPDKLNIRHLKHIGPLGLAFLTSMLKTALRIAKVLGLTLDPKLTYSTHFHNISVQAHKPLQMIKALKASGWGKQKETLMATYKAFMRPALEYASSTWSSLASSTSINKLQVIQNAALRTDTGCTQDTNIHLHDKTLILPIHKHLQLHALQYKQKTQHPSHPLHKHTSTL